MKRNYLQAGKHRADPVIDRDLLDDYATPHTSGKRTRFERPDSTHLSVTCPHRLPDPSAPFRAARKFPGPPPPTDPFQGAQVAQVTQGASFARLKKSRSAPHHSDRRPFGSPEEDRNLHQSYSQLDGRYSSLSEPDSHRHPSAPHVYLNGAPTPQRPASPTTPHDRSKPRSTTAMAIANPRTFPNPSTIQSRMDYHAAANDLDRRPRPHLGAPELDRLKETTRGKPDRPIRCRMPDAPAAEDLDIFAESDDAKHDTKSAGRRSPDNRDLVCVDAKERPTEQQPAARRGPTEKRSWTARQKLVKEASRKRRSAAPPTTGFRSVPLPPSKSSRQNSSVPTPSRQNGAVRGSRRLQQKHGAGVDSSGIKIPIVKSSTRQNDNVQDANGEAVLEQRRRAVKSQRGNEPEPVDLDGSDCSEPEKPKCRPSSTLAKFKKLKCDWSTARNEIEHCLRNRGPAVDLAYRGLVDTELSKVTEISATEDCNVTRDFSCNLSFNELTKFSSAVCQWFAKLHIQELDLKGNHLEILQGLSYLNNLRMLDLSRNELSNIPNEVAKLSNLRVLDLKRNSLRSLPGGFQELRSLEILDVSRNRLTRLPEDFAAEGSILFALDLSDNPFQQFPECVENLTKLEDLRMVRTPFDGLKLRSDMKLSAAGLLRRWAGADYEQLKKRKEEPRTRRTRTTEPEEVENMTL